MCSQNLADDFVREVDNIDITGEPFSAVLVRGESLFAEYFERYNPEAADRYGFKSFASIPVTAEHRVIGALNVVSTRMSEISSDDREILLAIGKELGSAIIRMRVEGALQESEAQVPDPDRNNRYRVCHPR